MCATTTSTHKEVNFILTMDPQNGDLYKFKLTNLFAKICYAAVFVLQVAMTEDSKRRAAQRSGALSMGGMEWRGVEESNMEKWLLAGISLL